MLEILNPVISLYKLLVDALSPVLDKANSDNRRDLQRRIIEIQLLLEDIIDCAIPLISEIKKYKGKLSLERNEIDTLRFFFSMQQDRLELLLHLFTEHTSKELMSLFAPAVKRRIEDLVCYKSAILIEVVGTIYYHFFSSEDMVAKLPMYEDSYSLHNWSHERFMKEESYVQELSSQTTELVMTQRIREQEKVIAELIKYSEDFANLIRQKINLEEAILPKKNRIF